MNLSPRQKKVYRNQDQILQLLSGQKTFPYVLSGGTALSRFYLHHRFSEDLDFFCEDWAFSSPKIEGMIGGLRRKGWICELAGTTNMPHLLKAASYTVRWKRNRPLKIDFLEDPFSGMWPPVKRSTESGIPFRVDNLDQIYYRKFFALMEAAAQKGRPARTKDLVDLFYLHRQHRKLPEFVAYLRKNHVPLQEEKIIMTLCRLKKGDMERGLKNLSVEISTHEVWETLQTAGRDLLNQGLNK